MIAFVLILFGIVMLSVGIGSAMKKPLVRPSDYNASELEAWKILEKRFGMDRAREIMEVERWKYSRMNRELKSMKWEFDTKTGEWDLQNI